MKHTFLRLEDIAVDGEMEQFVVLATNTNDFIVIKDKQVLCSISEAHNQDIT